jgi:hypothetical protein
MFEFGLDAAGLLAPDAAEPVTATYDFGLDAAGLLALDAAALDTLFAELV